ncbi:hypothetical protein ENSA5_00710 [Enhygromyxa salina]|uniref:Uncharacterized protein n=1 Tax=Enhygromyxa salina TaxID=215803 RepID=A0A2S9YKW5_9BACT|nr:hypothetical protein [Enhygromyxa salina]PRQ05751.1 hypothetical protein ENSA5_00710 [Enhygromyxa salina]
MFIINGISPATILLSALLACATQGDPATQVERSSPKNLQSPRESGEDQHFCCEDVELDNESGEGCSAIGKEHINSCANVLCCSGNWDKLAELCAWAAGARRGRRGRRPDDDLRGGP